MQISCEEASQIVPVSGVTLASAACYWSLNRKVHAVEDCVGSEVNAGLLYAQIHAIRYGVHNAGQVLRAT